MAEKVVRIIQPQKTAKELIKEKFKKKRVAAYCRVSTQQEEQLNSYGVQVNYYTEKINNEPQWTLVGIFADRGISGTSVKKRDEFNRMIRMCKRGRIDMIITKSISRFSRNTVDCLKYVRMLRDLNIDVYFEEQGLHSIEQSSELYITIYGSIAQTESENISANVKWGKAQSAKEGNVPFHYKTFLGYRRGADGNPEIDSEQAETIKTIYSSYLDGDSLRTIARKLNNDGILPPTNKGKWSSQTVKSILQNEKYKGDAILNKTYVVDCISKKVRKNNGERVKYYVENNHPAIIDSATFARVQEEMTRRTSKKRVKMIGTKTNQGRYSSMYALTELLVCGECGTPYRRCTWTASGKKKIVWRCINRLDYGKKYCHHSPSLEEQKLHFMIMESIKEVAKRNAELLRILETHIAAAIQGDIPDDNSVNIEIRINEIDKEFNDLLNNLSVDTELNEKLECRITDLMNEKHALESELQYIRDSATEAQKAKSRLDELMVVISGLSNHPLTYDDKMIRKIIDCIEVQSDRIKISFKGGICSEQVIQ